MPFSNMKSQLLGEMTDSGAEAGNTQADYWEKIPGYIKAKA